MYQDFREMQVKNNPLKDAVWVCTVKNEERFTVDLIYYKMYKAVALIHVGKDGYKNDLFYEWDYLIWRNYCPNKLMIWQLR